MNKIIYSRIKENNLFIVIYITLFIAIYYVPVLAVEVRVVNPEEQYETTSCDTNSVVFIISDSLCQIDTTRLYFSIINRNENETLRVSSPHILNWGHDSIVVSVTIPESLRGETGDTIGVICDSAFTSCDSIPNYKIYIADCNNDRIVQIDDMTGLGWTTYGTGHGSGIGEFHFLVSIAIAPDGKIYLSDNVNCRIVRIDDMAGTGWNAYGSEGDGIGEFRYPRHIAIGPDNKIYIVDLGNNRIVRINDISGAGWTEFGHLGSGIGEFHQPIGIDIDDEGRIYVSEYGNNRIVRFDDMTGSGWISFGTYGSGIGEFNGPCLLYTSPSPRDLSTYRMPSSA